MDVHASDCATHNEPAMKAGECDCAPSKQERVGDYMRTYFAGKFYPHDPRPDEIDVRDIALGLSRVNRFNGHTHPHLEPYTVAQHSVMGAWLLPTAYKLEFLLHDASEAYVADICRPVKLKLPDYKTMEKKLDAVIRQKFDLPLEMSPCVREMDNRLLVTEASFLVKDDTEEQCWWDNHPAYSSFERLKNMGAIIPWDARRANDQFLTTFKSLMSNRNVG